ncbi:hypothetical protein GCM10018793_60190 [Streptomyces sulfonofaciens]|uniref:Uncharacterized protein n=1 Tax=Streptomyces sulfonofaciens TaxID=68272 RepID=A0A919GLH0_9ACTN|nr:hypothetical protein [Streptomyces sulfonofaciens]GHH86812.1 hypothetical protein GCM10018793_60190 [Streptomyces sulfonofaciens]
MDPLAAVEKIARTCLYEGYLLWPYRRSALKNAKRWTFGGVYPHSVAGALGEPSRMRTEVLLESGPATSVSVQVRFLQVVHRQVYRCGPGPAGAREAVDRLTVGDTTHLTWQEATERIWTLPPWRPGGTRVHHMDVESGTDEEPLLDASGRRAGLLVRSWEHLTARVELAAAPLSATTARVAVGVTNTTACPRPVPDPRDGRDLLAPYALVSTHTVLTARAGTFASLVDPPDGLREAAADCRNEGTWPVLVGGEPGAVGHDPHHSRTVLSSPVTLYDFPGVAPESPGDLFDGGEIDHLLILNVLSLTAEEQREARATDPRAREILDRCAALAPGDLMALHGTIRGLRPAREGA